jgi:hypothetical protein
MWYTILITLVVDVGGLIVLYALLRDRVRRATAAEAQIGEIREEVSRLLVELNQTTDRNILLMEDRIGSLNELLAAADKKIGLLRREIEKHDVGSRIYSRLAQGRPVASAVGAGTIAAAAPAALPQSAAPDAAVPQSTAAPSAVMAGSSAVTAAAPAPPLSVELAEKTDHRTGPRRAEPARDPAEELQQRVLMLHRAGFSASLIAGRVGAPVGEVELIIGLEERKQAGS